MIAGDGEFFRRWAEEVHVSVGVSWTTEQICDLLVHEGSDWPPKMSNSQGWAMWSAVMRRDLRIKAITWDEAHVGAVPTYEILFRFQDKREFRTNVPRRLMEDRYLGGTAEVLEDRVTAWKHADDERRAALLAREDAAFAAKAPDTMEHLIGFRAWALSGHRIRPIGSGGDAWQGGKEVRAECCIGEDHRAPAEHCDCGLYAWHSWKGVCAENRVSTSRVLGAVQAHGKIRIHRAGFRAEYMRPVLLAYNDTDDKLMASDEGEMVLRRSADYERVAAVAKYLGDLPVVGYSVIERDAQAFGSLVPHHMKPTGPVSA